MRQRLQVILALAAAITLLSFGLVAHAEEGDPVFPTYRLHSAQRKPQQIKVVRLHEIKGVRVVVKFNNGARWSMGPCEYEDSERCFWDAGRSGYPGGDSFVRMYHHTFYFTPS